MCFPSPYFIAFSIKFCRHSANRSESQERIQSSYFCMINSVPDMASWGMYLALILVTIRLRNSSPRTTAKHMKSSLAAWVISLTKPSISSARELILSAALRRFFSSLYKPFASAFAFSFIADKGVLMSWESESRSSFLSLCMVISFLRLPSILSRRRLTPHVNLPKNRFFSSGIGTARLPLASSCGTSFNLPNGVMICL